MKHLFQLILPKGLGIALCVAGFCVAGVVGSCCLYSQETVSEGETVEYKKDDSVNLAMRVFYPPAMDKSEKHPAMVFFPGGGWIRGKTRQFEAQANYFAKRGAVCFLADFRAEKWDGQAILDGVMDGKSCIRFIRENANRFCVDGDKLIASGGSSGGHVAAAAALIKGYDDPNDNLSVSAKPNALVLFNPAIELSAKSRKMVGNKYKDISPIHNIKKETPPTIMFFGSEDRWISTETMQRYKALMEKKNNRCDLFIYEGQKHGFFNWGRNNKYFQNTINEADKFLVSLGYLEPINQ